MNANVTNVNEKTVFHHHRTISIVSDSTLSRVSGEEFKTPPSSRSVPWSIHKSPSASSFFSLTSETYYDCFEVQPKFTERKSLENVSLDIVESEFVNKAFEPDEVDSKGLDVPKMEQLNEVKTESANKSENCER